jgi:hypothetical protein
MNRRYGGLRLVVLSSFVLAGCFRRLPHGITERYIENLQQFNYPACYELLSQKDHLERTLPEFLTEIPLAPETSPIWFRSVLHLTHYELGAEERSADGKTAIVPVRVTAPDLPRWERALNAAAGHNGVTTAAAQRSLDMGDYPRRAYDDKIFLVKEDHHWRVVAGFAARDLIVDRHRQAMSDYFAQRYQQAIPQWRSMIAELRQQAATGSAGLAVRYGEELARMERLNAARGEAAAYSARLQLKGVAMKMSEDRVPAIFGEIRNTGDRPVDGVLLAVTWYTGRGKDLNAISREEHPVIVTPVEFTDFTEPVVPLMPGEARPFGFTLSAPANVQQVGSPYVTVASIALTDRPPPKAASVSSLASASPTSSPIH